MQHELTYYDGRECEHCGEPIADQAHKLRTHCRRTEDENGIIRNCKDDKNSESRKLAEEPYRWLTALQKRMFEALENLIIAFGDTVTIEQLNQYGVQLDKATTMTSQEGLWTFHFLHHTVEQQYNQTYKIKTQLYVL